MSTPPTVLWIYYDCGGSVGRQGTDGPPSTLPPIPDGCTAITEEEYFARTHGLRAEVTEAKAAMVAADEQAEAQRVAEAKALTLVDGPVTDASFPEGTPLVDGTFAVDAKNGRLYVRLAGKWKSAALS